jgi:hypothetical protein
LLQGRSPLILLLGAFLACSVHAACATPGNAHAAAADSIPSPIGYVSVSCGGRPLLIHLDDRSLGRCPMDSVAVVPGSYVLRAWPAGDRRFTANPLKVKVAVEASLETVVDLSSARWVRLETEPFGATVSRGGVPVGRTPLTLPVLRSDPPLIVERDGFRSEILTADDLLSGPEVVRIGLGPGLGEPRIPAFEEGVTRGRARFETSALLTGIVAVSAATAAVIFKTEADDAFDRYKRTGDLNRMNELFDRSESLDTWAVASWIVSEAALGLLVYQLLHDKEGEVSVDNR